MKSFGDRLRAARIAAGLTQEQLGFSVGLTKASVSAWENGRETPSFRVLPELRHALGLSLDELVCGVGGGSGPRHENEATSELKARNPQERALLTRYRALSPRRQEAFLELLKPEK
ncbi:helix-turn-helix transcriptional regulator [Pseudoxanthomonas sp. CF125]|uniref:helix-turn-helix domain-containing protein n=1 Tax=Pseudoxanthomonas sp. CF125 TaxID=1855303 RepID=UPI00088BE5B0|nr:helix-turn-helix transcriptional regulator [Pseudoxanthomonas sp. CF125]SDQ24540.1 Helix-turn-helix domain-containing protein [Pseudoxanthomonas sp. CF125]